MRLHVLTLLHRKSRRLLIALCVLMYAMTTILKYLAGPEAIFSAIYLIPVSFATWYLSGFAGIALAGASAASMLTLNLVYRAAFRHGATPYWNAAMDSAVFLFAVFTLCEVKTLLAREHELSREDFLTGIANRRGLVEALEQETGRARRFNRPLTLVYIDIDDFKKINDRYGHEAGDGSLCTLARLLATSIRKTDLTARLGGDEFVLMLPETDTDHALRIVHKLHAALQSSIAEHEYPVTFSIGGITFTNSPPSPEKMLALADRAMYAAKQAGKNRFVQQAYDGDRSM